MIKQITSEIPFLWKPKEGSGKSADEIVFRAKKNQRKLIAARLGLNALNDFKVKVNIIKQRDDIFWLDGHISAEIYKSTVGNDKVEEVLVEDGFQETVQLNVPEEKLDVLINDNQLITEFFMEGFIDLGEIAVQNLSLLLLDGTYQNILSDDISESMAENTKIKHDGPFSELASLLAKKKRAKGNG